MKKIKNETLRIIAAGTALILIYRILNDFAGIKQAAGTFLGALFPCFTGGVIALFLYRPASRLENLLASRGISKTKARVISVLGLYLFVLLLCALGLFYVVPVLYSSIEELIAAVPMYSERVDEYLAANPYLSGISTGQLIDSGLGKLLTVNRVTKYLDMVKNVASSVISVFVSIVLSVYLLIDREVIAGYLRRIKCWILQDRYKKVTWYIKNTIRLFCSYFAGLGADALIVGFITSLGLWLLGVDYPLLTGVIIAFGNLVPVFGCIAATVLSGILILVSGGVLQLVTMLLFVLTVYVADSYFIQPKIVGKSTGVRPAVALISVTVFGRLFGIVGVLLGVPFAAAMGGAIKILAEDYYKKNTV